MLMTGWTDDDEVLRGTTKKLMLKMQKEMHNEGKCLANLTLTGIRGKKRILNVWSKRSQH